MICDSTAVFRVLTYVAPWWAPGPPRHPQVASADSRSPQVVLGCPRRPPQRPPHDAVLPYMGVCCVPTPRILQLRRTASWIASWHMLRMSWILDSNVLGLGLQYFFTIFP